MIEKYPLDEVADAYERNAQRKGTLPSRPDIVTEKL